jgi:PAS domain S-box-containing protein
MPNSYSPQLVLLSIVVACVASYAALHLAANVASTRARVGWLVSGATAMGIGIWSMHFIAMLAYRLPVRVGYDVPLVALSLLIAIVASFIGLDLASRDRPSSGRLLLTGPIMGIAIAGMHYTGMASIRAAASQHYDWRLVLLSIVVAVAASYAALTLFLRFRFDRSRRGVWLQAASAVVMGHAIAGMHYTAMAAVHFEQATLRESGLFLPPERLAVAIAIATLVVLGLTMLGAVVGRWAQANKAIRDSEERFRLMVDAVHDYAIFTVDPEGRINSWNRGAERLLGYAAGEILGSPLGRLFPEASDEAETELRIARESGRHEGEGMRLAKDGTARFVHVVTTPMRDEAGQLIGFARVLRDVTERKRAEDDLRRSEEQLRQAQKMEAIGQLAGGVAHDFNNMLTAIRGYSDLLMAEGDVDATSREALDEIRKAADRAATLTRQLLAFSRKQVLQPRPVNPNAVIVEMESMLRRLLVGDVELVTRLDPSTGRITVDPTQIQQVLMNLVVNARDSMPHGGRLVIETANVVLDEEFCRMHPSAQEGPHVVLIVSDTGRGMTDEVRRHIFEPFFTTKERGAGTGLGLSTVYGIVKQSGGHIWVYSEPDQGTVFRIYFPRTEQPAAVTAREPGVGMVSGSGTVLLVDDEDSVRSVVRSMLERSGYSVLAATDGIEALQLSAGYKAPIHLLITDMMMPRMHGKELSERLGLLRPDMRVLFISGYADDQIIDRGLLDPRMQFIQKPFSLAELLTKVRSVLSDDLVST